MADDLTWLLRRLIETVPGTRSAVLLSVDGIAKYGYGLDKAGIDTLAALSSGICSLTQQVGKIFGKSDNDGVRQVITELDETILFVTAASVGSVLAVLADRDVDARVLGFELEKLCKQVPAILATPSRRPVPATGHGTL